MEFVTHLPWTPWRHDAVWVIVDWLTKTAHFLAVEEHDVVWVVYSRDYPVTWSTSVHSIKHRSQVYNTLLEELQKAMGTQLMMSTAFHPQTDGQSEMTIQVLEDMLRACVLDIKGSWEEHLPLVEFAYNNSY